MGELRDCAETATTLIGAGFDPSDRLGLFVSGAAAEDLLLLLAAHPIVFYLQTFLHESGDFPLETGLAVHRVTDQSVGKSI